MEEEEDELSYTMLRCRERREVYMQNYTEEYGSNTDYGHLVIQQRLEMVYWIVEQTTLKGLQMETLFLAVNLLDRFLSKGFFKTKRNLQVAAISCLALATRIEENQSFNRVRERIICVGSDTYSRCEVVAMEWLVQEVLNFQCFMPTIYNFLWFYLKAAKADENLEKTAKNLAVRALLTHEQLYFWPSTVAAGLVILASVAADLKMQNNAKKNCSDESINRVSKTHVRTKEDGDDLSGCLKIRTHAIRKAHENIGKTLKAAEVIPSQFDLSRQAVAKILKGPHEDLEGYLEAIEHLRGNIRFFSNNKSFKSSDIVVSHSNNLLSKAISKLEEEFKQLLSSYRKPLDPERLFEGLPSALRPSSESPGESGGKNHTSHSHSDHHNGNLENAVYTPPALIPPRILPLLHNLSQQMVQAGNQQQLLKIYRETRSYVLEESLHKLGVEKLSKEDVQKMQWEVLEAKIGNWIHFMRIAAKLLFAGERKVCDQMFEGMESLKDQCFAEVTASSVSMLLSFGEAIAKSKRSPEKLFVLLDMYEIMRELHSEIETLFKGKACSEIRESAFGLTKRLAQTAQDTFGDFEEAVEKDATKTAVLDGTVHPLTSYVINYVKFLFDYQSTLKQLFQEFENGEGTNSQLATVTMRIMQALQTNLDGKSKQYRDPALTQLFLMNNIHYMVRSVRRSEAKDLLGDDWVQRHRRIVQQHANQYKRIAWAKILQSLSIQGLSSSGGGSSVGVDGGNSSGVSRAIVKDRLKMFNMQFEELHQRQSQWTVPDTELRESLRLAVAEVLLPAYRSFIKRFGALVESGKNPQKYIRYTPEDLDRMLGEFFEGKNMNEPRR